ncbi:MAG: hypothetical protein ABSG43_04420 [Solirubrobacteraceae bacterium]
MCERLRRAQRQRRGAQLGGGELGAVPEAQRERPARERALELVT